MFCPNCGTNNKTEQKFCRACGLNLEKTAESLIQQIPASEDGSFLRQQQFVKKLGIVAFGGFGLVYLAGAIAVIYTVITQALLPGLFMIGLAVFVILALLYIFLNWNLKEKKEKATHTLKKEFVLTKETGELLDAGNSQPVTSVTEHTT